MPRNKSAIQKGVDFIESVSAESTETKDREQVS